MSISDLYAAVTANPSPRKTPFSSPRTSASTSTSRKAPPALFSSPSRSYLDAQLSSKNLHLAQKPSFKRPPSSHISSTSVMASHRGSVIELGKSRAISAFNSNPSMHMRSNRTRAMVNNKSKTKNNKNAINSSTSSSSNSSLTGKEIELKKQHLRGIFAAACVDHKSGEEMKLSPQNLIEAIKMTGLIPTSKLIKKFATENGKGECDLGLFVSVILKNLDSADDMTASLIDLFHKIDPATCEGSNISMKSLKHFMTEVVTTDGTQLSENEFNEFLEYAGLKGETEVDYEELVGNFMLSGNVVKN